MSALKRALSFVVFSMSQFAIAQNVPPVTPAIEQHIQHVENGLIGALSSRASLTPPTISAIG